MGLQFPVSSFGYMMGVQFPVAGVRLLCATGKLALPRSRSEHGHLAALSSVLRAWGTVFGVPKTIVESSTTETAGTWFPVYGVQFWVSCFGSCVSGLEGGAL